MSNDSDDEIPTLISANAKLDVDVNDTITVNESISIIDKNIDKKKTCTY